MTVTKGIRLLSPAQGVKVIFRQRKAVWQGRAAKWNPATKSLKSQLDACAKFALRWLNAQRATKNFRCQVQMHPQVPDKVLTIPDSGY